MKKKDINLAEMINDPFQGKGGFMPAKITDKVTVRIGLNENLAFPEALFKQLMKQVAEKIDPRIYPEDYCESLAIMLAKQHNLNPEQIVIGNGGDKIIDLMVRLTIVKGFNAVIINPTYSMYEHAVKVQGGGMKELFLTPGPEFDLDPDYIVSNITPGKDKLLFLCSPNNPTGNQFEERKLMRIINEFPGIVALDETYSDFGGYSFMEKINDYPNLIIMKSMSKYYGMAGMRLGYAVANEFLINRIKELQPAFNVNIASLELAKLVIQQQDVLEKITNEIISERERIFNQLQKIPGILPYHSCTNFILFKFLSKNASEIQNKLLKEKGVLVRNMSALPLCENSLRMSVTNPENNNAFLNSLTEIMNET